MHRAEKFLENFGEIILKKMEILASSEEITDHDIDVTTKLCCDYNAAFKFAEHHHELMCGCLHMQMNVSASTSK